MKINPFSGAMQFLNRVRENADGDSQTPGQYSGNEKKKKKDQDKDSDGPEFKVDDAKVNAAVDAFGGDVQAQSNGLSASMSGTGPGLKVVLKDASGNVLRQFTGEEFLRLREGVSKEGTGRGKLLDRRL